VNLLIQRYAEKQRLKLIWLSHVLSEKTPLYGGAQGISIRSEKSIQAGDSCNTSIVTFPSHAGSHVDAPYHFIAHGKTVDVYSPETWIFTSPLVLEASSDPGELISISDLPTDLTEKNEVDMVLLRTGFERYRGQDRYWKEGPGLSPEIAIYLKGLYPSIRAIAIDFISISSLKYREDGRIAHRRFLENGIIIFEDISLKEISHPKNLVQVIALPLRFVDGDGSPCTVIGWESES
jgi:kynurenine formamidase